jgi:hypothetical protein
MARSAPALAAGWLAVVASSTAGASVATGDGIVIFARAEPRAVRPGHPTTIAGRIAGPGGPIAGELLELQDGNGAGGRFRDIAHTRSAAGGVYRFAPVRPSRDTRYRVVDVGARAEGAVLEVTVLLPAYPSADRVSAAARYLARRAGESAFAVVDDHGHVAGLDMYRRFDSASVVKSMLLVAYLQRLAREHRPLDRASSGLLYAMIHSSDNAAASAVLAAVGQAALDSVARQAGMQEYERAHGWWAFTQVCAADMARFFFHQDALVPQRFDGYARRLLSSIEPSQSWGIPAIARPQFHAYFKGGWLPEEGVVNQVARLERPGITFALAVLSAGDPSMAYGEETIGGITARLLGRAW